MANTNTVITTWRENMQFHSTNPAGELIIDASPEDGGNGDGLRPKALMLSALAGCSGLDVASMIKKMKLEVEDFKIDITAELTDEHPKYYHKVSVDYHFYGKSLEEKKLQRAVDLSVEKYCGVMEMFRRFAEMTINTHYHNS
ncbi:MULTISPECIES: OsmC family protein [Galbibacter]|uniref:OsmC family protein n=1 Tax=Galbibacter pacificus TaxID=2996052 RepID=A0ABT6FSK5_9FLAO|nr:OsmC family protein [Galbibacter pacificus]MDG3582794.1 OsmC family protein [Galbibacter pacificus]MDG3586087.1 OsmC family protein [Galbibacter pacificus]